MSVTGKEPAHAAMTRARGTRAHTPVPRERVSSTRLGSPTELPTAPAESAIRAERVGSWARGYQIRLALTDVAAAVVAGGLAVTGPDESVRPQYWLASLAVLVIWPLCVMAVHGYERRYLGVTVDEYNAVARATLVLLGVAAVSAVALNVALSRSYLLILLPLISALSLLGRLAMRAWLRRQRAAGRLMQRAVVIGRADLAADLVRTLTMCPDQGLEPVAVCTTTPGGRHEAIGSSIGGIPVLGRPHDALDAVDVCDAEVVVVASSSELTGKALRRLAWALEERDVELLISTGLIDVAGPRLTLRPSEDTSFLHVERPAARRVHAFYKGVMDRMLAALLILVLSPVLVAVAVAIKVTSPGPILFRQTRIGVAGQPFRIFKFRTMVVDAEKQLASLLQFSDGNSVQFKMKSDPRVTAVGVLLRRYSLDELPQLFNVVLGTMSLVGPRPQSQQEVDQYEPDAMRRLHVRPGMTGLWQISGRSDLSWEQSLRLDLRYVDNWSPLVDLQILFRTFRAVVHGSGAY